MKTAQEKTLYKMVNNSAVIVVGECIYRLMSFFTAILIARAIGGQQYGEFSFIYAYLAFFEIFVQFGFNSIITREISQHQTRASSLLGSVIYAKTGLIAVAIPSAIFLIKILGYPLSVQQGIVFASFQLILTMRSVFEVIFRVNLRMIYPVLWNLVSSVSNLMLVWLVTRHEPTLPMIILCYIFGGGIGLLGLGLHSSRYITVDWTPKWVLIKEIFRKSLPLFLSGFLTLLFWKLDVLMLSKMRNFIEVGYYSVAARFSDSLMLIATSLMASFFPVLSQAFSEDRREFENLIYKAFNVLLLIGLPMAIGGAFVSKNVIVFFFGPQFAAAGFTLSILLGYTTMSFISIALVNILIACGRQIVDTWVSLLLACTNFATNLVLIPVYGYNGAAVSIFANEIFDMGIMLVYLVHFLKIPAGVFIRRLLLPFKVNAIFLPIVFLLRAVIPSWMLFVFFALIAYALLLFGAKIVGINRLKSYMGYVLDEGR